MHYRIFFITILCLELSNIVHAADDAGDKAGNESSALVKIAKSEHKKFTDIVTVYGAIKADQAHTHTVSAPRELNVESVSVRPGQSVKTGDVLITLRNSANGEAQFLLAKNAVQYAQQDLKRNREILKDQLATRDQVSQAEKTLLDAQSQLSLFDQSAHGKAQSLKAQFDGVVIDIAAKPGDILAAGAPVMTIGEEANPVIELGFDAETAKAVKPGAHVSLESPTNQDIKFESAIQSVSGAVDPTTKLVFASVVVNNKVKENFLIGNILKANVDLSSMDADTVPRAAIMEDEDGTYVFTVEKNVAHKTAVTVLKENDDEAALENLPAGTSVVISGNSGLDDGVAVREKNTKDVPAP